MPLFITQILLLFLLFFVYLLVGFFLVFEVYVLFIAHRKGGPFVPSSRKRITTMLALANLTPDDVVTDLGSGHGPIVVRAAERGVRATGVEINPFLVLYSRWLLKRKQLSDRTSIIRGDLKNYSLSETTVLFLYLMPKTIDNLLPKIEKEMQKGSRIISNTFPITGWTPEKTENNVYMYVKK